MGSFYGYIEHLACQNVGGADTACDHGGPGPVDPGVGSLSPAESKFHDPVPLGSVDDSGRLGGDKALVVDDV